MSDISCFGIFVTDVFGKPIDEVPQWERLGLFSNLEMHTGGCAANTGRDLAILGINTAVGGRVGADGFGEFVINSLSSAGLNTRGIKRDADVKTAFTFVMVSSKGERRFLHYIGANAALTKEDFDTDLISSAKILHIAGTGLMPEFDGQPTADVLKITKESGIITSMDTAYNPSLNWGKMINPCLPLLDIFIPSIEEAQLITGKQSPVEILKDLSKLCKGIIGVKAGVEGCYLYKDNEILHIPIYKVEVKDTSGAGDAFMAGFLCGILKGMPLDKCGKLGNAVAACCVQEIGCYTGIKPLSETLKMIKE